MADFKDPPFTFISTSDNSCVIRHIQNHIVDIVYCLYHLFSLFPASARKLRFLHTIVCFGQLAQPKALFLCNPDEQTNRLTAIAFAVLYSEKLVKLNKSNSPHHPLPLKDIRFAVQESFFQKSFSFFHIRLLSIENTVKVKQFSSFI